MQKILFKTVCPKEANDIKAQLRELEVEVVVCDLEEKTLPQGDFSCCILNIDFEDSSQLACAREFADKNNHIKFYAYVSRGGKEAIINAHGLGCSKLISKIDDLKSLFGTSQDPAKMCPIAKNTRFKMFKGLKVLMVDDIEVNINLLREVLSPFEFDIKAFTDPVLAADALEREHFDLIFLDVVMPKINGFELARIIKSAEINKNTPLVFVTGNADPENKVTGFELGTAMFIEKPLEVAVVRAQVFGLLNINHLQTELIKQKENFIAMMTHDLKTPIRAQISALGLLLDGAFGELKDDQREIINEIMASNKYMQTMTDNILLKYKSENGELQIQKARYNIKDTVESAVSKLKYVISQRSQSVNVGYELSCDFAHYDEIEIERVLTNLIVNASEYSPEGSKIKVFVQSTKERVEVSIEDSGCGIEEDELELMMNKYTSNAKEYKKIGTGLGLYICKKIVACHGGEIKVQKLEGRGSRFTFTLSDTQNSFSIAR